MDANRVRISLVREQTVGVTPATPKMRTGRITGESLAYAPSYTSSDEIRSDRSTADPVLTNITNSGAINFELFYPASKSFQSELLASAFMNDWDLNPEWDNSESAAAIGAITTTSIAVADLSAAGGFAGTAVKTGHLMRLTGTAANNTCYKVTASTATSLTVAGATAEATPPATARAKVVGVEGAAADITATATGLASTTLDFTTFGLIPGQWIKVGGTAAANRFATAQDNDWVRVVAIAAHALTCDNLPSGWTADTGTGKTIRIWFGDTLVNGTTQIGESIERSFLDQAQPTHILQAGMMTGQLDFDFTSEQIIKVTATMTGMKGSQGTTPTGASYAPAPAGTAMAANVSVGRIAEGGTTVSSPNWVKSAKVSLTNNLRTITAVGNVGAVGAGAGECGVTGTLETYFGSNAMLAKLLAGTPSSISLRSTQNGQAVILQVPREFLTGGSPNAGQKNSDVTLPATFQGALDPTTGQMIILDRVEYFEA